MSSRITMADDKITSEVYNEKGEGSKVITSKDSMNISFNMSLLEALQNEQAELLKKLSKIRQEDNYGTYKNIIMALSEVTRLIERNTPIEKWEDRFSHYKEQNNNGEWEETVSTWQQKGEDIRDHKIYKIDSEIIKNKKAKTLYGNFEFHKNMEEEILLDIPQDFQNENTLVAVSLRSVESDSCICSCSIYGKMTDDYKLKLSLSCDCENIEGIKIHYSYVLISNN